MSLISPEVAKQVQHALQGMLAPVSLIVFTQADSVEPECTYCADTVQLIEEIAALDERLSVVLYDIQSEPQIAASYHIDKVPAIAILRNQDTPVDYGVRMYGIPAGYEFSTLIEDILLVSNARHGLSEKTLEQIGRLDRPVEIQVYVTPT